MLIVRGRHRGQHAVLLQKNTSAGAAAVRLDDGDMEIVKLTLDDIAEYVPI